MQTALFDNRNSLSRYICTKVKIHYLRWCFVHVYDRKFSKLTFCYCVQGVATLATLNSCSVVTDAEIYGVIKVVTSSPVDYTSNKAQDDNLLSHKCPQRFVLHFIVKVKALWLESCRSCIVYS